MNVIIDNFPLYVSGFLQTLRICAFAALGSLVLGTVIAGFRVSPVPPLRWVGTAWVTVFRNCPLTVVLFFCAFGLPEIGVNGAYFWFGVTGLILYTSAFVCEAVRSGINSVPAGQAEAARAVGLTFSQSLTSVVLPQALRTVVPPLGSVIIAMIKNSAIVGAFGVGGDLFAVGDTLTSSRGEAVLPVLIGVVLGYLVITIPGGLLLGLLERKVAIAR
ncbi:amino acid ABC transporter permease [Actinokineospora globicatena]|uniref:Amino acid ABC transporter permease n=1 Tax=Actinokineospora globicatena TaxID=103729 RepID=A0A9W6QL03_9PSEU|nr:amino acid ABC transporter permease [Actinokineospora globicatena]MCP2302573.1 glutamate transport system permease protein [Actinokineospora globicatena]GLW75740.1 amino acid ABC transporter permease [Actinokineospora globicatena]GLW82580.1 amino acid ABC transporter permease [Actinokineospora globicatena]GLW91527.1 amino acid ABC transporter permease [Actinokineospora globicatena]